MPVTTMLMDAQPSVSTIHDKPSRSGVLVVSFSGGRTSALMARLIQTSPLYADYRKIYCYANTGREREETLRFIRECDERWKLGTVWLEAVIAPEKGEGTTHRVVDYTTALRNTDSLKSGHPFFDLCKKYGIPSNSAPHCTRELKTKTIASYLRSIGVDEYIEAWGIRSDEPSRLTEGRGRIYPLAELGITEEIVRRFWDRQDFDLGLKQYQGNCDLCFKKSLRKRLTILRETPEIAEAWASLEGVQEYGDGKTGYLIFDRSGLSVSDLLKLSRDSKMESAVDAHDERLAADAMYPQLFPMLNEVNFDFETHCHCHST